MTMDEIKTARKKTSCRRIAPEAWRLAAWRLLKDVLTDDR